MKITALLAAWITLSCAPLHVYPRTSIPVDILPLTLDSAESYFLQRIFQLLAQKYNIDTEKRPDHSGQAVTRCSKYIGKDVATVEIFG